MTVLHFFDSSEKGWALFSSI